LVEKLTRFVLWSLISIDTCTTSGIVIIVL
jgi:hypothetical protein